MRGSGSMVPAVPSAACARVSLCAAPTGGAARRAGAIAAAQDAGLPEVTLIDAGPAPVSMRHGAQAIQDLGAAGLAALDALVCVSDPVAFGCLSACQRLGLKVPDDIAITGFGSFEVAQVANPAITTMNVNARSIGEETVAILAALLEDPTLAPRRVRVATSLEVGKTS